MTIEEKVIKTLKELSALEQKEESKYYDKANERFDIPSSISTYHYLQYLRYLHKGRKEGINMIIKSFSKAFKNKEKK